MHIIAAKAVALGIASTETFRERQRGPVSGARIVAEELVSAGVNVLTGGTDVHLGARRPARLELDGQQARTASPRSG